jgi:CheY-like chemotaxis protein
LVVDDHADAADSLALVLSHLGHRAVVARCGRSALAAAEREAPDVVLLELRLPCLDGWEVARQLRAAGCPARLIAVTTCGRPADRQRSRAAGIDLHLVKPVDPPVLLAALLPSAVETPEAEAPELVGGPAG